MNELSGDKPVILTGAASGVGNAVAERLSAAGANVIAIDIKEPTAPVTAFHQCDLGDPDSIDAVVQQLDGPYCSLLNVAGVPGSVGAELTMRVNYFGLKYLTELLWDKLADNSTVVNVASIAGNNWRRRRAALTEMLAIDSFAEGVAWYNEHEQAVDIDAYTLSKEAVVVYTMQLARRGLARGIRVNDVGPGPIDTPILPDFTEATGEETMSHMIDLTGRPATPDEIAEAIIVLAEARMSWLNGQHIIIDGGMMAGFSTGT